MIYEITYLSNSQEDYKKVTDEVKSLLEKMELKLVEPLHSPFNSNPRRLGYPINHQMSAYYQTFRFEDEGKNVVAFEKEIKFNKGILRYLITKIPKEALETKKAPERPPFKKADEPSTVSTSSKAKDKNKAKIEELDKKLDEILDNNIL